MPVNLKGRVDIGRWSPRSRAGRPRRVSSSHCETRAWQAQQPPGPRIAAHRRHADRINRTCSWIPALRCPPRLAPSFKHLVPHSHGSHNGVVRNRSIGALFALRILLVANLFLVTATGAFCFVYYERPEAYVFSGFAWWLVPVFLWMVRCTDPYRRPHRRQRATRHAAVRTHAAGLS